MIFQPQVLHSKIVGVSKLKLNRVELITEF